MDLPEPLLPLRQPDNPCAHCGRETGSDAMTFCSMRCQDGWKQAQELKRVRDNLADSKGGMT